LTDVFKCVVTFQEKFSPIYRTWTANKPQVHLLQPEDVEVRSSRKISDFLFKSFFLSVFGSLYQVTIFIYQTKIQTSAGTEMRQRAGQPMESV
jgi:hypothetical protein